MDILSPEPEPFWTVKPKPAFCAKLRRTTENGEEEKIFLNFCTCLELPAPVQDMDEDRLAMILESSDPGRYRIPISVSDAQTVQDHRDQSCNAYDIILNDRFYKKRVLDSELFRNFLVLVAIDSVETKHGLRNIDRQNWVALKNRKLIGELQEQRIRKEPRPTIEIVHGQDEFQPEIATATKSTPEKSQLELVTSTQFATATKSAQFLKPRYEIRKDHAINPSIITAIFYMDGVKSRSDIDLDVGEHRIRVVAFKVNFSEDVFVPMALDQNGVKANFVIDEEKLVVEIPLCG